MKNADDLVRECLLKASKDKLSAQRELMFSDPVLESACFHAQQAVEKMLKAYCIYYKITPPRTHDISSILQALSAKDPNIAEQLEQADELSDYAVDIRYPESPSHITLEDANEAISVMKKVDAYLDKHMPTTLTE
jgi:HEPN domain-containing protein